MIVCCLNILLYQIVKKKTYFCLGDIFFFSPTDKTFNLKTILKVLQSFDKYTSFVFKRSTFQMERQIFLRKDIPYSIVSVTARQKSSLGI